MWKLYVTTVTLLSAGVLTVFMYKELKASIDAVENLEKEETTNDLK